MLPHPMIKTGFLGETPIAAPEESKFFVATNSISKVYFIHEYIRALYEKR